MLENDNIYLIGIGGIGMSALARYFHHIGKNVAGYDRVRSGNCESLEKLGIPIHYEDNLDLLSPEFRKKNETTVIFTPAIPEDHSELKYFIKREFTLLKRAKVLGEIAKRHTCLAVAGTHGKTTTSALLAHIFRSADVKVTAFLGGIAVNYNSNFLAGEETDILIAEADEYDRSFLQLKPDGAIITSVDADHLDIYDGEDDLRKTFSSFSKKIKKHPIIQKDVDIEGQKYGLESKVDFHAENIRIENHSYTFDLVTPNTSIPNISSGLPGRHNVENAVGAAALARNYGLSGDQIKKGIESFKGVKRRFEYHIKTDKLVYIDDYAHHPSEIMALVQSVKELYPGKKVTGIFQPHLFSRTRDFADAFADSLSLLDSVILMEIYPAREKPIAGVNSEMLLSKIDSESKFLLPRAEISTHLKESRNEVVLTIGAGDIDQMVNPIKMILLNG